MNGLATMTKQPHTRVAVWLAAIRPATLWAGAVPVIVGAGVAASAGAKIGLPSLAALVGALLIQVGTNLVNDYADFKSGADGPDRLGPARVTALGWLSPRTVLQGAMISLGAAGLVGIYIVYIGGWPLLAIGLASIVCAVAYTAGPLPLGYVGLGDIFVFLFFGWAAVGGTFYLETGTLSSGAMWVASAVGALGTAILVVNNLRDRVTDARVGKRTLVVRFGPKFARLEYAALVAGAYLAVSAAVATSSLGSGALAVWLSAPLAVREIRAVWRTDGAALNPLLGATARLELIFGLLLCLGVVTWP